MYCCLPESGCEIYGPYKGSSSCGWQTVYILQDRRSWLLTPCEIVTEISLWITTQGIFLHVGWYVDFKALVLAWNCNMHALVFLYFYIPTSHLHHLTLILGDISGVPPHWFRIAWPGPPYTNIFFRLLPNQQLQSLTNLTCINIRVSACSRKPLRSASCFPASCSPLHIVLFYSCLTFEVPLPSSIANLDPWLPLDCSILHPCVSPRVSSSNSVSVLSLVLPLSFSSPVSVQCFSLRWRRCCLPSGWLHSRLTVCCSPLVTPCCIVFSPLPEAPLN